MTVLEHDQETKPEPAIAGWFADPQGAHKLRYFDGEAWTDHVTHFGPTPCEGCSPK